MKIKLVKNLVWILLSLSTVAAQSTEKELILEKAVAPHTKIDDVYRRFSEAYKKFDSEAVTNLYTDDAFYLSPGSDVKRGREKVLAEFSGYFNSVKNAGASLTVSFRILDRSVSGDLAYDVGIYTVTEKSAKGETQTGRGKFVVVARRMKSGEWRFHIDSFNSLPNTQTQNQNMSVSSNSGQGRSLNGNKIVSLKNPPILIEVDEQMPHVGILNFKLKEVAQVERYIYARHDESKRIQRLFIAQFESILPGIKGGYDFQVINPTRFGNHDYQTDIGIFNFAERIAASPKAEAEYTKALLDKSNLKADDDFLMARYARITSEDKRTELILFYLENLKDLGLTRAELESNGSRTPQAEKLFRDFADRALKSFKIADRNP